MGEVAEAIRLLSPAAAGAELKISRQRVNKLAEKWPEVRLEGKIDVERLRQLRDANLDPLKQMAWQHAERQQKNQAEPDRPAPTARKAVSVDSDDEPEQGELGLEKATFNDARTHRERSNARLAELKVLEQEGLLISRLEVESVNYAIARRIRDRLLGLPTKLQQFVPLDAMPIINDEIEKLIHELAEAAASAADGLE